MIWACDTSALVKRYVQELGSRWFRREVDHHIILIATSQGSKSMRRWQRVTESALYWQRVQTDRLTPRRQDAKRKNLATWRLSVRREEKRHLWPRAVYLALLLLSSSEQVR
jgi:hypothetical protein